MLVPYHLHCIPIAGENVGYWVVWKDKVRETKRDFAANI